MYLIAGSFIALVAIYIGFTILRRTHEGLSDGASTTNDDIVAKTTSLDTATTTLLANLTSNPTQYIKLLTSYKNNKMATAITSTITNKNGLAFGNIADYDEAIAYLRSLGVSDMSTDDPTIDATITTNNTSTTTLLSNLGADNQAYIDLLTSYKNNKMASGITNLATTKTTVLQISEIEPTIDYLRTLGGITVSTTPYVPTTRNISLSSNNLNNL
jgi:cbb3-type cytochrome oxidase cytochrome c subunit